MGLMTGKRGIVFGIANDRSYATFITKQLLANGAECGFTHLPGDKMANRCRLAIEELGVPADKTWLQPCDASKDEDLDAVFAKIAADYGKIDFIVHSIAFADRAFLQLGNFHTTTRAAWSQALDISAYTLLAMAQRAVKVMPAPNGGSIISMTYYGGEKVIPGYNIMGVAKAALEHTTRYLAWELGEKKIRVNTISGGPLRTLAAQAVGGIKEMFDLQERKSALRRNIEGEEVGNTAVYLLSDLSSGVTGETIHVDAGFSIVGL
ncbi:MAG: enoyl-ACP reductase [Phycisphaeraceae bacterium]|nr:enoyl-ACP reductase [Phycisphaeraceae bacterium]